MNHIPKILCIDDEEEICFALKALFKSQNWNGLSAHDMEEGIAQFRNGQPDIVLIDYHMPGISGLDGVCLLRKLSATVPIIVFTIDESQAVADAFMEAGASDFALKPIKAPDIVSRIKLHLRLLEQNDIKAFQGVNPSKGISQTTLNLISVHLEQRGEYETAQEIANGTGLAYQTTYRYLQYMAQENMVEIYNIYGKVGRPKQLYRKLLRGKTP